MNLPSDTAPAKTGRWQRTAARLLPGLVAVVIPKCPLCAAAYLNLLGLGGMATALPSTAMNVAVAALLLFQAAWIGWRCRNRGSYAPLLLVAMGGVLLLANRMGLERPSPYLTAGAFLLLALASLPGRDGRAQTISSKG